MYRSFLSKRYLRSRFVNFISVAAVMAGVAVMIVVMSVMDGMQAKVKDVVRGTLSHLVLVSDGSAPPFRDLDDALQKIPGVVGAAPEISVFMAHPWHSAANPANIEYHFLQAIGIDWEREKKVSALPKYLRAGDPEHPFDNAEAKYHEAQTAMFSMAFLEQFQNEFKAPRPERPADYIGRTVEVLVITEQTDDQGETKFAKGRYQVYISAVYDAEDQQADFARLYMDFAALRDIARVKAEYMEVHVALRDYAEAPRVKREILGTIPGIGAQTWEEVRGHFLKAVNNEKVMLLVVLSFIVLLAGFTILATLTLTVVEKTHDIGLLKAIGATTGGVLSLFLRSGLLIGVIGGVLGLGLGILVSYNVNGIKDALELVGVKIFPADLYLFRDIPTERDAVSIAGIVLGGVGIAFLAGLPPALRAARMDPVEALRHE